MVRFARIFAAAALALAAVACSHGSDRPSAPLPAAPSAAIVASGPSPVSTINTIRPTSVVAVNPLTVDFPPRNEAFDFRNRLEAKYRDGLRRPSSSTFVDIEGDVVWTQEYLRLPVNDCDHITAVRRVFAATVVRGSPTACNAALIVAPDAISFPPRNEPFDFRRQLDLKYQSMGRPATATFVDVEGIIVWLQE